MGGTRSYAMGLPGGVGRGTSDPGAHRAAWPEATLCAAAAGRGSASAAQRGFPPFSM